MAFRHTTTLTVLFLGCLVQPAYAQRRDTTQVADSARAAAFLLPPIVVSAARTPVRPERVGFAIGAVLREELDLRRPRDAAEALRDAAGAYIDEAAGPGGPTIIRLRGGEEVFTHIRIDGIQINENGGFFDFQGFVPSNIERIEIARGPQSALYGSSAVSGVVSFVTTRGQGPLTGSFQGEGSGASDDGKGWKASGNLSGATERVSYSAGAGASWERGIYAIAHDVRSRDGALRIDVRPGGGFDLTGTARYLGVDAHLPVRDPGATRVPLDPNATNSRDRGVGGLTARWTSPSGGLAQQLRVAHFTENFVYDDERDDVAGELPDLPYFVFDADFTLDADRSRTTVEYAGSWAPQPVATLSWGAQWEREALTERTAGDFGDGEQSLDRASRALFGELLVSAGRFDFLGGIRVEDYEGIDAAWTPRASVVLHAHPAVSLRAAAGRAFKAPNLQQQYLDNPFIRANPDIQPETGTSWEAGVDLFPSTRLALSLTWFDQRFHNLIRSVAIEGSPTGQQINRNLGESQARGLEWMASWRFAHGAIGGRGSFIDTEVIDNVGLNPDEYPTGEVLPFRAKGVHTVWIENDPDARVTARLSALHVGERIVLTERFSGQREPLDPYTLLGLSLRWRVRAGMALFGRIDNLFDTDYDAAFDRRGSPLDVAIGLRIGTS
jgi:vitamin B12 transporter